MSGNPESGNVSALPGRADERLLAFRGAVIALVLPTVLTYVWFEGLSSYPPLVQNVVMATCKALQFGFPLAWVGIVLRRRISLRRPSREGMFIGAVFGLLVATATVALYASVLQPNGTLEAAAAAVREKVAQMHWDTPVKFFLASIFYSVLHSLLEEYYWRWFVFGQLRRLYPPMMAVIISSLGFTAHHVLVLANFFGWTSPWTYVFSFAVAFGGAFWAWLYQRSNQIYSVWLSHLLVDAGIFLVGFDMLQTG